jgi:ABC-type multidrug transport system ATPase subunit
MGTEKPIDCGSLSHCGNKSEHPVQFSCMVVMILFDILLYIYLEQRQNKVIAAQKIVSGHQGKAKFQVLPPGLETNSDNPIQAPLLVTEGGPVGSIFSDAAAITASPNVDEQTGITSNSSTYQLVRGFTRARGRIFSLDFEFERLGLVLPNGNAILQSVSARVKPGCVTAIMGPSGAGKTTLLNTLMGKQSPTFKQTGTLKINGKIRNIKDFRSVVGFVPQEDIMIRELSVRDNIEYSARIRLPPSWSDVDITEHVDAVLDVLSLAHVQHTRIGDEKTRGVSGGQRKRVNIGIEVAACPVALYLDEPTSGLDATAALAVTDALKEIAHTTGITVAMVIHQPRYEIWEALDEVLFLAPGWVICFNLRFLLLFFLVHNGCG